MTEIVKDNAYYWEHPEEYTRLKESDLKYEPTVYMCEFMLQGLREEIENVIDMINRFPKNEDCILKAQIMKRNLEDPFIDALTFGHGQTLVKEVISRCPEGVFDIHVNSRQNENMERRRRIKPKTDVNPLRYKRVVT